VNNQTVRCGWVADDQDYIRYHDEEWGVPVFDDGVLFEFLILEGAQAGLNWLTVLRKRNGYRTVFKDFDVQEVAALNEEDIQAALRNKDIIRNKLKIRSAVKNAQVFIAIQKEFGSFSEYLWAHVEHTPVLGKRATMRDVPSNTALSDLISKDLQQRGMSFVGSTIIYAYLQAVGVVNDHEKACFRYQKNVPTRNAVY